MDVSPTVAPNDIGIVLSGGGTRGIAHIGVLRALIGHGIYPDRIAGASAGAIVGALYAAGYEPREMLEFFEKNNPFRLSNVSITKPGIIDTDKVRIDFEEYFPDNSFEALQRELRVMATDLTRGEPVEFHTGALIPAVLASSSYPMMFTPIEIDGRLYADGGIVSNFPVELLEGRCGVLLGVHASGMREMERSDFGNALAVLKRALEVGMFQTSRPKYGTCDVVIRPPNLSRFGIFETKHNAEIEAIGYEAALERMPEILRAVTESRGTSS
jgi:NTE family protein